MSDQNNDSNTESQSPVTDPNKKQLTLEELEGVSGGAVNTKGKYCDSGGYCEEVEA